MKISKRGRYGMRLLLDLAEHGTSRQVTLMSVGQRKSLSARYMEQVAIMLRRAGIIRSVKGSAGGYMLAKPPDKITVGDALRALEGDMLIIDPPVAPETKMQRCIRKRVFAPLNDRIAEIIDGETIAELVGTADPDCCYMYFI
jgi:Rrf2 family protein